MARYIGAVCRMCRRSGGKLFLKGERCYTPKCSVERRLKPPGQQVSRRRRRVSDRALQLREKQKARYSYGILERQFRRLFGEASRQAGVTGDNLLILLERRLDNMVHRLGFADSRSQARQLIRHGHITLNDQKTDIPSALVREGDKIGWVKESAKTEYYKQVAETIQSKTIPGWLGLDKKNMVGEVLTMPTPEEIEATFDGKTIVEYYSR